MQPRDQGGNMKEMSTCGGRQLREMFQAGVTWIEKAAPDINALNVFPVPDGDCGTNMLLTIRHTVAEAYHAPDHSAAAVAQAMAHGALLGARGNSGVILSQIFRGLASALENKDSFTGPDFAEALAEGARQAARALTHPVEGTIITVARDAAEAASRACSGSDQFVPIVEAAVAAARESVANTPRLLPVLAEAGVVDAGGQGYYTILEGVLSYLKGEAEELTYRQPQMITAGYLTPGAAQRPATESEDPYGYCTEFVVQCPKLDRAKIEKKLIDKGQSLIIVGDEKMVHIHIHTFDPGWVLRYAAKLGTLHEIKIQNMDDQHREFVQAARDKTPEAAIAIVAVASGDGLANIFRSLGTGAVIPGGQSMNPSTQEILLAIASVPQEEVIVLPNNKNVAAAAEQARGLTDKKVAVVPSETVPQGIAACLSFDFHADLAGNVSVMEQATKAVRTGEVTRAARSTTLKGVSIPKGQAIGLIEGELLAAASSSDEALWKVLEALAPRSGEMVTIYGGGNIAPASLPTLVGQVQEKYSGVQVESVFGGQPHYDYIVSAE